LPAVSDAAAAEAVDVAGMPVAKVPGTLGALVQARLQAVVALALPGQMKILLPGSRQVMSLPEVLGNLLYSRFPVPLPGSLLAAIFTSGLMAPHYFIINIKGLGVGAWG
jgi:hypothetical protein